MSGNDASHVRHSRYSEITRWMRDSHNFCGILLFILKDGDLPNAHFTGSNLTVSRVLHDGH